MFSKYPLILLLFVSLLSPAMAQKLNLAEAINQAGLQRMLSQRMAKNYMLISQNINTEAASVELDESASIFEENLFNLSGSVTTDTSKKALKKLKKNWYAFRALVLSNIDKGETVNVVDKSTILLKSAHELVLALERTSKKRSDKLINISGRQRMLSQRLAMLYYASNSGQNEVYFRQQMKKSSNEFTAALDTLLNSKENTKSITESLNEVKDQWSFYKTKFESKQPSQFSPRTIKVISESILVAMNDITKQYEIESITKHKYTSWILG